MRARCVRAALARAPDDGGSGGTGPWPVWARVGSPRPGRMRMRSCHSRAAACFPRSVVPTALGSTGPDRAHGVGGARGGSWRHAAVHALSAAARAAWRACRPPCPHADGAAAHSPGRRRRAGPATPPSRITTSTARSMGCRAPSRPRLRPSRAKSRTWNRSSCAGTPLVRTATDQRYVARRPCWAGQARPWLAGFVALDRGRSTRSGTLAPLAARAGVQLHQSAKGSRSGEAREAGLRSARRDGRRDGLRGHSGHRRQPGPRDQRRYFDRAPRWRDG